jgi:hypothetical protein
VRIVPRGVEPSQVRIAADESLRTLPQLRRPDVRSRFELGKDLDQVAQYGGRSLAGTRPRPYGRAKSAIASTNGTNTVQLLYVRFSPNPETPPVLLLTKHLFSPLILLVMRGENPPFEPGYAF